MVLNSIIRVTLFTDMKSSVFVYADYLCPNIGSLCVWLHTLCIHVCLLFLKYWRTLILTFIVIWANVKIRAFCITNSLLLKVFLMETKFCYYKFAFGQLVFLPFLVFFFVLSYFLLSKFYFYSLNAFRYEDFVNIHKLHFPYGCFWLFCFLIMFFISLTYSGYNYQTS